MGLHIIIAAKTERTKNIQVDAVRLMSQHVHAEPHTHQMFKSLMVSSAKRQWDCSLTLAAVARARASEEFVRAALVVDVICGVLRW